MPEPITCPICRSSDVSAAEVEIPYSRRFCTSMVQVPVQRTICVCRSCTFEWVRWAGPLIRDTIRWSRESFARSLLRETARMVRERITFAGPFAAFLEDMVPEPAPIIPITPEDRRG
jgi:hypothetical protein